MPPLSYDQDNKKIMGACLCNSHVLLFLLLHFLLVILITSSFHCILIFLHRIGAGFMSYWGSAGQ